MRSVRVATARCPESTADGVHLVTNRTPRGPGDPRRSVRHLETTYNQLQSWIAEQGIQPAVGMWECYITDPEVERDPAKWQTMIIWPIS